MTTQEKKDYLLRYRYAEAEERRLEGEIERWRSRAENVTAGYGLAPTGGGDGRSLEHAAEHICQLIDELEAKRTELAALRREIGAAIDAVPNLTLQRLLYLRYIDSLRWEQIAVELSYSYKQVLRLHGKALALVKMS